MNLVEWTTNYIKHRDLFFRKITDMKIKDKLIIVTLKDKVQTYKVLPVLEDSLLSWIQQQEYCVVVCSYAQSNLDFVLKQWSKLSELDNLLIIFADPKSGKKLLLNPKAHSKIAEPETLQQGLLSMFQTGKGE